MGMKTKLPKYPSGPLQNGKSHLYGVFMGGGTFDEYYNIKKRAMFKTAFQIRGPKTMQTAQKVLFDLKTYIQTIPRSSLMANLKYPKIAFS